MGLADVIRGKPVRTTMSDKLAPCPLDRVNRVFHAPAPNLHWLPDFTYASTWSGFVYVAFLIDAYARRIVGWRVSRTAHGSFVLDAQEPALRERRTFSGLHAALHLYEENGFVLAEERLGNQWGKDVREQRFVRRRP